MANPFIGEIKMFGGNFPIVGWAFCDGSLQSIAQNEALFSLLGTTYGGDGQSTFGLPDFRSRVPLGMGTGAGLTTRVLGSLIGTETAGLTTNQIPAHTHSPACNASAGISTTPAGNFWAGNANSGAPQFTSTTAGLGAMNAASIGTTGSNVPHENRMPFLALNFLISLYGIYPSQS